MAKLPPTDGTPELKPGGAPIAYSQADSWTGELRQPSANLLLGIVFVIATAGLIYELVMAAVASYVLGDSVRQFSLVIGTYLSALGMGAYASRFIGRDLEVKFIDVELSAAMIGGFSAPALFLAYSYTPSFSLYLFGTVILVGTLVGLELPLLVRILERQFELKELIARTLSVDYLGALIGSLTFSLFLFPQLGLVQSSLVCGLLNAAVALASTWVLNGDPKAMVRARLRSVVVIALLATGIGFGGRFSELSEAPLYNGEVLVAKQSAYQRIVVTETAGHISLFLNGKLQFAGVDESIYHEALVHPAMASTAVPKRILIGGGGDGLAVRELLRWPEVESITLVDLDPAMTDLAQNFGPLQQLNEAALSDPRVTVQNADAFIFLAEYKGAPFDVMIFDFPDPSSYGLGKLYSMSFYRRAAKHLAPNGSLAVHSRSPYYAPKAFWCVVRTLEDSGFNARPYHAFVPSFGEWGYVLAKPNSFRPFRSLDSAPGRKDLTDEKLALLFSFPEDMKPRVTRANRLNNQVLVSYYESEWGLPPVTTY